MQTPVVVSSPLRMDPIAQMKVTTEKSWADLAEKEENLHQVNKKKKGS